MIQQLMKLCDEIIESYIEESNLKNVFFFILSAFLLIIIRFLIAVSIYYYLKKHLITFHDSNNELREVLY